MNKFPRRYARSDIHRFIIFCPAGDDVNVLMLLLIAVIVCRTNKKQWPNLAETKSIHTESNDENDSFKSLIYIITSHSPPSSPSPSSLYNFLFGFTHFYGCRPICLFNVLFFVCSSFSPTPTCTPPSFEPQHVGKEHSVEKMDDHKVRVRNSEENLISHVIASCTQPARVRDDI